MLQKLLSSSLKNLIVSSLQKDFLFILPSIISVILGVKICLAGCCYFANPLFLSSSSLLFLTICKIAEVAIVLCSSTQQEVISVSLPPCDWETECSRNDTAQSVPRPQDVFHTFPSL